MPRLDHTEHVRLMMDLILLAFWSDSTRVSTFMFGNAVSGRNFSFLDGVSGGHHEISHHQNNAEKLAQYQRINRWHVEQYAYLIKRMQAVREGEGTLLDHSVVMFGSGLRDGNSHNPHNLLIILAGNAGGAIQTGRHLRFSRDTPLANLYVAMLNAFGRPTERFADSVEPLKGILRS